MSIMIYAFFACFLAIGLGMLGFGLKSWSKSNAVGTWPTTEGRWLERSLSEDSDSDSSTYRVVVRYAYSVGGRSYESDRLAFGYAGSSGREGHQAILDKVMRGETVRVRYNPSDPAEAALADGLNRSTLTILIFGAVWTMFTLGLFSLFYLVGSADTRMIERLIVR